MLIKSLRNLDILLLYPCTYLINLGTGRTIVAEIGPSWQAGSMHNPKRLNEHYFYLKSNLTMPDMKIIPKGSKIPFWILINTFPNAFYYKYEKR